MKYILLNLKRFDVPREYGGVSPMPTSCNWGSAIIEAIQDQLSAYSTDVTFHIFFPESHIISAVQALKEGSHIHIGCQSVHREDVINSENFGAFTSHRLGSAMKAIGCTSTIIGHIEERRELGYLMGDRDIDGLLNEKIKTAQQADLKVVYCIGEREEEKSNWKEVLKNQLVTGLKDVDMNDVVIAYEPVWAIGPGKPVPTKAEIEEIIQYLKEVLPQQMPIVYGGGMKMENSEMLASIGCLDGGLIALTRFSGDIGFYPDEYLKTVEIYLKGCD